jgi:hypothetical protein
MSKSLYSEKALSIKRAEHVDSNSAEPIKGGGNEVYQDAAEKQGAVPSFLQRKRTGIISDDDGQVYCRKVAKNFGQSAFLSAREIEHGRFRALFAHGFALRYRMVELRPKNKKKHSAVSPQHSAKLTPRPRTTEYGWKATRSEGRRRG